MTELTTLPLTGLEVPHTRYSITSLQQVNTRNGIAFSANVKEGNTLLGVIENHGDGGGTWFYPAIRHGRQAMAEFTAACRWKGEPVTEEQVYDRLIDEYDLARTARRCARQRTSLLRGLDADGDDTFLTVVVKIPSVWLASGTYPYMPQLARGLARYQPAPAVWQVWDGKQWQNLSLPDVAGSAA
ncbi:hypothetical protein [Streptomyces rubradiris]|uniref:hypothetical protein n=1 Tax=Streptomyces rubradiris TaxID=285531 RepID=UPI001676A284|nr:hypothetical protein [Streptomyces rubradiris]GHH25606.1 hypothetical protein GCM10018792_64780 [Streptomyces rubradiris]